MQECKMQDGEEEKRYQRLSAKTPLKLCYQDPQPRVLCMIWSVGGGVCLISPSFPSLLTLLLVPLLFLRRGRFSNLYCI